MRKEDPPGFVLDAHDHRRVVPWELDEAAVGAFPHPAAVDRRSRTSTRTAEAVGGVPVRDRCRDERDPCVCGSEE